ncbi:uncharacterized protein K452DRAFT_362115 [Aplosporella prunicola CBS 121167]|uniref:AA1-like domain-containing protein n=1 Tax=Aplosporella prunicola CBS 121167 TaxID=1176127 RepID=A0A6A6B237_9PEZI|nr:uncharacterized protein K452DRAFT_362115 [Aplosporella prunicola CBS 121167]KAF2137077.1 hypothetical protein K452DRAFT_362115 [Aplosporella prunicola CBS 121167]
MFKTPTALALFATAALAADSIKVAYISPNYYLDLSDHHWRSHVTVGIDDGSRFSCEGVWLQDSTDYPHDFTPCQNTNWEWFTPRWVSENDFDIEIAHTYTVEETNPSRTAHHRDVGRRTITEADLTCSPGGSGPASHCATGEIELPIVNSTVTYS